MNVLVISVCPHDANPEVMGAVVKAFEGRHAVTVYDAGKSMTEQFASAEAVVDVGGWGTNDMIDAATNVRFWQILGTGVDHMEVGHLKGRGICAANCPGTLSAASLAEVAMMMMLMLAHRYPQSQEALDLRHLNRPYGTTLAGRTLAMVGFGASAQALAPKAKAFDMRIEAIDVQEIPAQVVNEIKPDFLGTPGDLDEMIRRCDVLSLHVPATEQTRGMIDVRRLSLMKPTAYLINVARGALVDEEALYEALVNRKIAGAGFDVVTDEPLDPTRPIRSLPNVVITPHNASATDDMVRNRVAHGLENVNRIEQGLEPLSPI